jgi:hypothetical protein
VGNENTASIEEKIFKNSSEEKRIVTHDVRQRANWSDPAASQESGVARGNRAEIGLYLGGNYGFLN